MSPDPVRRLAMPLFLLAVLPVLGMPGCAAADTAGSGRVASASRTVEAFRAVQVAGAIDLVVRQAAQHGVQVQADDNLLPLLETVVEPGDGGRLSVRWKPGTAVSPRNPARVTVDLPQLAALSAAGSGSVVVQAFETPALKVSLSGSSDLRLERLATESLELSLAGSGSVRAAGHATRLAASISGSGEMALADLRTDDASVSVAGSGDVKLDVHKTLDVSIAGSGDVSYSGNPTLRSAVAGRGRISRR